MELTTNITCPHCKRSLTLRVREMVLGTKSACPHCKTPVAFAGDDGRKTQRAMNDLENKLKQLL